MVTPDQRFAYPMNDYKINSIFCELLTHLNRGLSLNSYLKKHLKNLKIQTQHPRKTLWRALPGDVCA
jgi:hypothetical protein